MNLQFDLHRDDVLFFMHIPKTAGITFRNILENHFDLSKTCPAYYIDDIKALAPSELQKYRLFRGHIFLADFREILPQDNVYCVTMLRDPVKYTLSHFEHIRRDRSGVADDVIYHKIHTMSFDDYIRAIDTDPHSRLLFDNLQTRFFLSDQSRRYARLTERDLEEAKQTLRRFLFFGIVENFGASMQLLSHTLGWKAQQDSFQLNTAPQRHGSMELSQESIDVIKENMRLDLRLYAFAQKLFRRRFQAMCDDLHARYGVDPRRQGIKNQANADPLAHLLGKNHRDRGVVPHRQTSVAMDFSRVIDGRGWFAPKRDIAGKAFRWSGPTKVSCVNLPMETQRDLEIQFRITEAMSFEILKSLSVCVNGGELDLSIIKDLSGETIFEALIPSGLLQRNPRNTTIKFKVAKTLSPGTIAETRYFLSALPHGLAFEWLKLAPAESNRKKAVPQQLRLEKITRHDVLDIRIFFDLGEAADVFLPPADVRFFDIPFYGRGYFERMRWVNDQYLAGSGWSRNLLNRAPSTAIILVDQNKQTVAGTLVNLEREDVARRLKSKRFKNYGWRVYFDRRRLQPGPNRLRAYAWAQDKKLASRLKGQFLVVNLAPRDYSETTADKPGEIQAMGSPLNSMNVEVGGRVDTTIEGQPVEALFLLNHQGNIVGYMPFQKTGGSRRSTPWRIKIDSSYLHPGKNSIRAYAFLSEESKAIRLAGSVDFNHFVVREYIDAPYSLFGYFDQLTQQNANADIEVRGWAIDATRGDPAAGVILTSQKKYDDRKGAGFSKKTIIAQASVDQNRPDVAAARNNPRLKRCGWQAKISTNTIGNKNNRIQAYAYLPEYQQAIALKGAFIFPPAG